MSQDISTQLINFKFRTFRAHAIIVSIKIKSKFLLFFYFYPAKFKTSKKMDNFQNAFVLLLFNIRILFCVGYNHIYTY
jgi:hypothetical protein